jgi:hypothetical protein
MPALHPDFGPALRRQRRSVGYSSAEALAKALTAEGVRTSASNVNAWENSLYEPKVATARLLDRLLEADGALLDLLEISRLVTDRFALLGLMNQLLESLYEAQATGRQLEAEEVAMLRFIRSVRSYPLAESDETLSAAQARAMREVARSTAQHLAKEEVEHEVVRLRAAQGASASDPTIDSEIEEHGADVVSNTGRVNRARPATRPRPKR